MSRTGWCLTRDCDTQELRGGCPIVAGNNPPCACSCHGGSVGARPFLPITPRFAVSGEAEKEPGLQDTD